MRLPSTFSKNISHAYSVSPSSVALLLPATLLSYTQSCLKVHRVIACDAVTNSGKYAVALARTMSYKESTSFSPHANSSMPDLHLSIHTQKQSNEPPLATNGHRIKFKTAVLVYKCLHGMAPPYLALYCTPVRSHHKLDDPTCDPPQQVNSLCHVQGQPTAAVALWYMALL